MTRVTPWGYVACDEDGAPAGSEERLPPGDRPPKIAFRSETVSTETESAAAGANCGSLAVSSRTEPLSSLMAAERGCATLGA